MSNKKFRLWIRRCKRAPHTAAEGLTTQYHRLPQKTKFIVFTITVSVITAVLISDYPPAVTDDILSNASGSDSANMSSISRDKNSVNSNVVAMRMSNQLQNNNAIVTDVDRGVSDSRNNLKYLLGYLIISFLIYLALYKASLSVNNTLRLDPQKTYWVAGSTIVLQLMIVRAGMFGISVLSERPEIEEFGNAFVFQQAVPLACCSLLLALLAGTQIALIAGLIGAILVGFVSPTGPSMTAFTLVSSTAAIYGVHCYRSRNVITLAASYVLSANLLIGLAAMLISDHDWTPMMITGSIIASVVGAALTAAIASLAVPIYEWIFDILTDLRLLELSCADNKLLRELAMKTPGTNQHSQMVAMLAEEAAKSIGANSLLVKVGCLYHDIGKLTQPRMFVENQGGCVNHHDEITPQESVKIITAHVRRGIQLGKEHHLPPQIIDFIPQHHGTRVLSFFYQKARKTAEACGQTVDISDFRYPGPKPQSKEAVILMLADGSEASVRSLEEPTPENIGNIVKKISDTIIADGQLDESNITMLEFNKVRESLVSTLIAVHHHRIEYPGFNPPHKAVQEPLVLSARRI